MKKRHLALAAGSVLVLIGLAMALTTIRPRPVLAVRCSKVALVGNNIGVTAEITNRTDLPCGVFPVRLEMRKGANWTTVTDPFVKSGAPTATLLDPHGSAIDAYIIKGIPTGARLRIAINGKLARSGLQTFALRARLRIRGDWRVSLNPFDKTQFFTGPVEVVTDEFAAP